MTYTQLKKELIALFKQHYGNDLGDTAFRTGKDGAKYSEYCDKNTVLWISLDGSVAYDDFNYGEDGWKFYDAFHKFLDERGFWCEQGEAWNINVYRKD
jgi:hypothetical protein